MRIRTIIVDDQLLARESLRRKLEHEPDIDVIGMAASGKEAVDLINGLQPDLVFLDVKMADIDGFAVVKQLRCRRQPAIIFVTSNEEYALKAFDINAVDYLIKPCDASRLKTAVHRARDLLQRGFLPIPNSPQMPDHLRRGSRHS